MTGRAARRSRPSVLGPGVLLACLLAWIPSCGGHDEERAPDAEPTLAPEGGASKLTLRAVSDDRDAWPDALVVQSHDVVREAPRWRIDAPAFGLTHHPGVPPTDVTRALAAGSGRRAPVRFVRPGSYDLRAFDTVRLALSFQGAGSLRVMLRRKGVLVAESPFVEVPVHDLPTVIELALPASDASELSCDALVIDASGTFRTVYLSEVELLRHPLGSSVPDPEGGARLARIGHDARRCVGLLPDRAVTARGSVPAQGRLEFSWGVVRESVPGATPGAVTGSARERRGAAVDDVLEVLVEDGDERLARHVVPLPPPGEGWRSVDLDLAAFAGREVTFRFALRGGRQVAAVLEEPWLVPALAEPPSTLLLVTSDTHRGDHVGVLGRVDLRTPALDALAGRGVMFDDAWSTINNTTPSHAALFTGVHPRDTGVLDNFTRLASEAETLAEALSSAGFATWAAVSSVNLSPDDSGLGQGFDRVSSPSEPTRGSGETVDEALGWLPDGDGRPLFLWVHVFDAHIPYEPPADVLARLWDPARDPRAGSLPEGIPADALPASLRDITDLEYPKAEYRAEIEAQDAQLARLFAAPRLAGGVIALVADHGECLGEGGILFSHIGVLPATLHVPLVLAGPGVPEGVRTTARVQSLDLGRTLLDLADRRASDFPGRDLLEQLDPARVRGPRFALEAYASSASVEVDGLLCVLYLTDLDMSNVLLPRERHEVQLFDVRSDPSCEHDLLEERFDEAARLRALILAWLSAAEPVGLADHGLRLDDAQHAALESLGYVQLDAAASGGTHFEADDCVWCRRFERR